MEKCLGIRVVGIHPYIATPEEFDRAYDHRYGDALVGKDLEDANRELREQFAGLHLLEIEVEPPDCLVDWITLTQPIAGKPPSEWQVPWDERSIGNGRWAFFLHFVQLDSPLKTSIGPIHLPAPTAIPSHLAKVKYDFPG
jgi:hypothetical protein